MHLANSGEAVAAEVPTANDAADSTAAPAPLFALDDFAPSPVYVAL